MEASNVEETEGRLIATDGFIDERVFDTQWFGGAEVALGFNNANDLQMPSSGIRFNAGVSWRANLEDTDRNFLKYYSDLTFYLPINHRQSFIFATRVGFEHINGDFEFFQGAILDGNSNFRGFRRDRFYGNSSFFHQSELRLKIATVSDGAFFPFSYGITGGFDHGRVWLRGEDSNLWHYSYGGGLWISPVDFIVINSTFYRSDEANLVRVTLGFSF